MSPDAANDDSCATLEVLNGRYQLLRPVGGGRLGTVFEATRVETGERLAVRVIDRSLICDVKHFGERFFAEGARRLALSHNHTLRVLDYGRTEDDRFFLAMDYVQGTPLTSVIARRGPFSPTLAAQICDRVCASLEEAHRHGVTHAHLSPHLVWLTRRGLEGIKVVGFGDPVLRGIAQLLPWQPRHVRYAAPERITGERITASADVYGVGLLLYELIAGRPAFDHDSAVRVLLAQRQGGPLNSSFGRAAWSRTPHLADIVSRCLEPNPSMRFASIGELRAALTQPVIRIAA